MTTPRVSTRRSRTPHPLELYRWATQAPDTQAAVLEYIFRRLRPNRRPAVWREDFAGTAADATAWVAAHSTHRAIAVEHEAAVVTWAQRRARRLLGAQAKRLQFVTADVLATAPPQVAPADILSVLNFSICYFHAAAALRDYFRHARRCLKPDGVLVLNLFGGAGATRVRFDRHLVTPQAGRLREPAPPPFEYHWEHRAWRAAGRRIDCRIHLKDVFVAENRVVILRIRV